MTDTVLLSRVQIHAEHVSEEVQRATENERLSENPFNAINRRVGSHRGAPIGPAPAVPPRDRSSSMTSTGSDATSDDFIRYKMEGGWPVEEAGTPSQGDESVECDQILALEEFLDSALGTPKADSDSSPEPTAHLRVPLGDGQQITFDLGPIQESAVLTKTDSVWDHVRSICSRLYASLLSLFDLEGSDNEPNPKKFYRSTVVLAVFLLVGFGAARALGPMGRRFLVAVIQFVGSLSKSLAR